MGISGKFNDFQWEADVTEDDLDTDDSVEVTVTTPTGGNISFTLWGPFADLGDIEGLIEQDVEHYTDLT